MSAVTFYPNSHVCDTVARHTSDEEETPTADPRTELDSHANMVVFGSNSYVFESTGRTCNVHPFSTDLGSASNVPIVDAAVAYDCPYSGETFVLVARNALYIKSMEHNLIPPFIMRAGGVTINEVPKIQCKEPTIDDHCIYFAEPELRIPLHLSGIFSYFHTRAPTLEELHESVKLFITPDSSDWNPHCLSYERNERSMLDYEGNMSEIRRRSNHHVVFDEDDNLELANVSHTAWESNIDMNLSAAFAVPPTVTEYNNPSSDVEFCNTLNMRAEISKVSASIGSCNISNEPCPLFDMSKPSISKWDAIEETLKQALDPEEIRYVEAKVASIQASRSRGVSKELLSKLWMIPVHLAEGAIEKNTQLCRQSQDNSMSRQYTTNDRMLRYKRLQSVFYTDTMFASKHKSTRGNKCCQVFVSDKGYVATYPMKSQQEFQAALHWFCKEVGVPVDLIIDGFSAQKSPEVRKFCEQVGTTLKVLERATPWANRAELYIGLLKEAVRKDMRQSNSPMVLWDFAIERRALIHNAVPRPLFQAQGKSPHECTFGVQGDISKLCTYGWYEWVYYRDFGSFPENKEKLGRVLGPCKNEGNEMAQSVVTSKGTVITRRTLRKLRTDEIHSETEKRKRSIFDDVILKKLGDSMSQPTNSQASDHVPYSDDVDPDSVQLPEDNDPVMPDGTAVFEKPITDQWIHAELNLPQGELLRNAKVVGRSKDGDGNVIGSYDPNPFLNTMIYDVQFPDGEIKEYAANVIAENMYAQVDDEGHQHQLLDSIIDFKKDDNAVEKSDMYIHTRSGQRRLRQNTAGWFLLILWKNGEEEWMPLKLLKETLPIETAEFAVSRGIADEPAFKWWVPYTLRRRDRIIASVNSRIRKVTHKYGVELPTTVKQAQALDEKNGNTFWTDAINKEMENLKVAFDILDEGSKPPPGYKAASGHLVFDVRMTLERKARWVKDGHKTPEPEWSTFAGVVSRESVRIALTYSALNDLPVCAADIQNAYLQAPSSEKHYVICGPEFGLENIGKYAIIVRALYGGKSAGADYWRHVRLAMEEMGFQSCKADPDVWLRPSVKANGVEYYQYVLLYTDDILAIMEEPERFLREELGKRFTLKEKSIGPPEQYLGNKVSKVTLANGKECWSFSSSQYVQAAVKNVEDYRSNNGLDPLPRAKSPWPSNYRPEIDVTAELSAHKASYYQSLIGILRWIVELGRGDLAMEVSAMASMMALPREGHLKVVFQMFAFLKSKHNGVMVFDPTEPDIDLSQFPSEDWSATPYGPCKEDIPSNAPPPRGIGFTMRAFVDSDHAGDSVTRRSRTGFMVFLNSAPIFVYSKKQGSCETSSFGSEFIAMKSCCEYIRGLRYKLRMMGIPVEHPAYVFGDNQSVLSNTSKPHSTLKKKSASIAFHFVREGVAKNEWRTTYLNTHLNPADMCTKSLPGGEKRSRFTGYFLHYLD